jgi:glycosyltransferase 2 family protein
MSLSPTNQNLPLYKTVVRPLLFIIGLIFFIFLLIRSWNETKEVFISLNWGLFFLSLFIALLDNILLSVLFQNLLTKYDLHLTYPRVNQMYFYGQVAKYIPGRFWSILYQTTFVNQRGATSAILFANLDLTSAGILRNIAIALALILFFTQPWFAGFIFLGSVAFFWYFCKSCWIASFFKLLTSRIKFFAQHITSCQPNIYHSTILLVGSVSWVTYLLANFLLMEAAFNFPPQEAALYIAYFSLAWVIGVIAIIIPAGIGIRELVFVFLAQQLGQAHMVSTETLISIAIIYRFWHILLEFMGVGIATGLNFWQNKVYVN